MEGALTETVDTVNDRQLNLFTGEGYPEMVGTEFREYPGASACAPNKGKSDLNARQDCMEGNAYLLERIYDRDNMWEAYVKVVRMSARVGCRCQSSMPG